MARDFNGTSDFIVLPDISSLGNFTLSIWSNTDGGGAGTDNFFGSDNFPASPRNGFGIQTQHASSDFLSFAFVGGTGSTGVAGVLKADTWQHFIIRRDGTSVNTYVDGVAVGGTITVGSGTFTAPNIRLGAHFFSGGNNEFFDGLIAEVAIYSTVFGLPEIEALADSISPFLVRPESLIRYWEVNGRDSPEIESIVGSNGIVTGTTFVPHPRIIYPTQPMSGFAAAAAPSAADPVAGLALLGAFANQSYQAGRRQ